MNKMIVALLVVLQLLIAPVAGASAAEEKSPFILGVHPYLPPAELEKRFNPLLDYLSKRLDVPMKLVVSKDYESHIENIGNKLFDFAYLGPASYVGLTKKYGRHPLLARLEIKGKPYFNGYIVTKQDSAIQNVGQLKGKKFAFGSPQSTMSYKVPRFMLQEAGVNLESLSGYKFQGNHRNVALSVLLGEYDAGAVKEEVYFKFKEKGLRQIAISPSISEHVFVCGKGLPTSLHMKMRDEMYKLSKTEEGRQILKSIKKSVSGLVPVSDKDYDNLREIMR
ncbi:MAG: phosphate/phosphite/phosphonate ABC transporter substrate-binding protein [Gammaproteobacteria bacterium]|nr:phosphate/phosphite/phosphonate ABC transporter substrate-binding protein [Gammaproteobacteria bacterium]